MISHLPATDIAAAVAVAKSNGLLVDQEIKFPTTEQGISARSKRDNWPYRDAPAKGGKNGIRREYLLAGIPGLPVAVKQALGITGATAAAQAALEIRTEEWISATEKRQMREEGLARYNQLPSKKKQSAEAKKLVIDACKAFLQSGGWHGRCREGQATWNKEGVDTFCSVVAAAATQMLPDWVMACLVRKGEPSLGYRTIVRWRDTFNSSGMWGLADKYQSRSGSTSIPEEQQEFLASLRVEHPHFSSTKMMAALNARFQPPLPSYDAVNRWIRRWEKENAELLLYLTNPDAWKNKYMVAYGDASEVVVRLNQIWEADSTPGDLLLIDGRHTIIGIIDVFTRRMRLLVSPTSKSSAIGSLLRRCILLWGICEILKTDNGQDYVAVYLDRLLEALEVEHKLCPPFSPEKKPHIERGLQTMSHGIVELLPGYIGHSVADRKAIEAKDSFAKRLCTKGETVEVKLTSDDLQKILDQWLDNMYHRDAHGGLDGKTPDEVANAWTHPIRTISDERALDILLFPAAENGGFRTIGKKGVELTHSGTKLNYWHNDFLGHMGRRVMVRVDVTDLGHVHISLDTGEFLCWAKDDRWYGISRQETASHARNKQKKLLSEMAKISKKLVKEQNTGPIYQEIIAARAEEAGKLTYLRKQSEEYTTPALDQALRSAVERDDGRAIVSAPLTSEQSAIQERMKIELKVKEETNVRSLEAESSRMRYKRMKALRAVIADGGLISEEEYKNLMLYERSAEFKALKGMEEENGKAFK